MNTRRKTRARFCIDRNKKFSETTPEVALDSICESLGLKLVHGAEIQVPGFTIRPDRIIVDNNVVLEADGNYHNTKIQGRKANWRDEMLIKSGYRVLHIESELLVTHGLGDSKRFWPYVSDEIRKFLDSQEPVRYLKA